MRYLAHRLFAAALLGVTALGPVTALADTLRAGYPACSTKEELSQYIRAATYGDDQTMAALLAGGCIVTKADIPVSIIQTLWTGQTQVRAYIDNKPAVLWTSIQHIQQ